MVGMLSPITAQIGQPERVDIGQSILGGMQVNQNLQRGKLQNQAMQQDITEVDYQTNMRNLQVMNRLLKQARQYPPEQRAAFAQSLDQNMLAAIGVTPDVLAQTPMDDAGLDQLIGQTDAVLSSVMPQSQVNAQFGAQETLKDEKGNLFFSTSKRDPRTGQVTGVVAAVDGSDTKPVGQLSVAGGYGLTASERVGQLAAETGAKTKVEQDIKAATEPQIQAEIEKGKQAAKQAEIARADAMKSGNKYSALLSGFEEAKNIIPLSTGSTLGGIRDAAMRIVGYSTDAAQNSARLKALAAWLVTQVPKPGGAVSDADLEQFKKAVGQIDDISPPEERLAAVDTAMNIVKLWQNELQGGSGQGTMTPQVAPQPTQKQGGQIMIDANGNRAMVYPDGTYEEL